VPDDLVAAAAAELYAGSPEAFTARRVELAAAARAAGDRAAATAIGALRKPTRAAWVVNQLTRSDPTAPAQLTELGAALLAAQRAGDGTRLRELSAARAPLLDSLAGAAFRLAGVTDPPPGLRAEVSATLEAALADPEVAAGLAAGTLTKGSEWAGFGPAPVGSPGVTVIRPAAPPEAETAEAAELGLAPAGAVALRSVDGKAAPDTYRRDARQRVTPQEAAAARQRRAEEEAQQAAAAAAEREARQQRAFEESERALAVASTATAEAQAAEERLETEVRRLEERLTSARAELAAARMRARRAEAADRRARLAHERLARPDL
jgi:hypothetical protein